MVRFILLAISILVYFDGLTQKPKSSSDQAPEKEIQKLVSHYANEGLFNGSILVARKGKVIYKQGTGYANMEWKTLNTTDTKFRLGSISKQFTSMLVMQLVNEGRLMLDGKITDYLPHYRKETGDKITIHHLLTHSSGIPNYTEDRKFWHHEKQSYTVSDFIRIYCSGDLEFDPGSRFAYSNSGYFILGAIIEVIAGKPYHVVLKERILDVAGMKNTGYDFSEAIIAKRASGYTVTLEGYKNADTSTWDFPTQPGRCTQRLKISTCGIACCIQTNYFRTP